MEDASYFREKAKQCRRLAKSIVNGRDPTAKALFALAQEFEARADTFTADPPEDVSSPR